MRREARDVRLVWLSLVWRSGDAVERDMYSGRWLGTRRGIWVGVLGCKIDMQSPDPKILTGLYAEHSDHLPAKSFFCCGSRVSVSVTRDPECGCPPGAVIPPTPRCFQSPRFVCTLIKEALRRPGHRDLRFMTCDGPP